MGERNKLLKLKDNEKTLSVVNGGIDKTLGESMIYSPEKFLKGSFRVVTDVIKIALIFYSMK